MSRAFQCAQSTDKTDVVHVYFIRTKQGRSSVDQDNVVRKFNLAEVLIKPI